VKVPTRIRFWPSVYHEKIGRNFNSSSQVNQNLEKRVTWQGELTLKDLIGKGVPFCGDSTWVRK